MDWVASGSQLWSRSISARTAGRGRGAGSASGWRPSRRRRRRDDLGLVELLAVVGLVDLLVVVGEIGGDGCLVVGTRPARPRRSRSDRRPASASAPVRSPSAPSTRVVRPSGMANGAPSIRSVTGRAVVRPGRASPARPRARAGTAPAGRRGPGGARRARPPRGPSTAIPRQVRPSRIRTPCASATSSGVRASRKEKTCAQVSPARPTQSTQSRTLLEARCRAGEVRRRQQRAHAGQHHRDPAVAADDDLVGLGLVGDARPARVLGPVGHRGRSAVSTSSVVAELSSDRSSQLPLQRHDHGVHLVRLDQHVAGLRALARARPRRGSRGCP